MIRVLIIDVDGTRCYHKLVDIVPRVGDHVDSPLHDMFEVKKVILYPTCKRLEGFGINKLHINDIKAMIFLQK